MRTIRFLLKKEFKQIFRNKSILALIVVMPVMQLIVMPLAADYEVKNINLAIVDHDVSKTSKEIVEKAVASGFFSLVDYGQDYNKALKILERDKADLILEIPSGFERRIMRENEESLLLAVNAINGVKANLGSAYLSNIIRNYNETFRNRIIVKGKFNDVSQIEVITANRFNIHLNYRWFMVPGILAILVTMVGGFLTALNIVKEKESGTIEQINVSPIKRRHFILGKLIPFWILGIFVFTMGMLVSYIVYNIVPDGHYWVLYVYVSVYLLAVMGFGLLVSTFSETQQQAMFIMFFFMMVFILMGGLFTPIESMPSWAQDVSKFNPMTYFIQVMRMVILKGSDLSDILRHLGITAVFALSLNTWAILNYSKKSN